MTTVLELLLYLIFGLAIYIYIFYQRPSPRMTKSIYDLVESTTTISSEYAKNPSETPASISKRLYGKSLEEVREAKVVQGNFGSTQPSQLFLSIYNAVLVNLAKSSDPMNGMVSPPLIASSGVVPLTIIAPLPDIVRHMSNCIVRAKREVFLATNFWINSESSKLITNAFLELNKRAGERGEKVVVKVLYDRGNVKQVIENHQKVSPKEYSGDKVAIPPPEELPHLDVQVVNYHVPLVGTFHSKFMVVDRNVALLMSNNIQDNDNVEMMSRLEGPIVDSLYDVCLASWGIELDPPLPCRDSLAASQPLPSFDDPSFLALFDKDNTLRSVVEAGHASLDLPEHTASSPHYDDTIADEIRRIQAVYAPKPGESHVQAVSRHFNITPTQKADGGVKPTAPEPTSSSYPSSNKSYADSEMTPYIPLPPHSPVPMMVVSRAPYGTPTFEAHKAVLYPQNVAFLEAIRGAKETVFIQTPNLNAEPLLPELIKAIKRGVKIEMWVCLGYNDAGELLPYQNGTNEMIANRLYNDPSLVGEKGLTEEEKERLGIYVYIAKDQNIPIHNKFKKRSCHIKLLIADSHIAIQGNGNQDTQSWFHSQEVNVMLDSEDICARWMEGIRRNQNTELYGLVSRDDGCWHDPNTGEMAPGAIGVDPGKFSWAKGMVGAVQRVRGAGGF